MYIIQRYLYIQRNTKIILSELTIKGWKSNRFDSSIFSFHASVVKNVDYSRTSSQIVNEIGFVIKPENEGQILPRAEQRTMSGLIEALTGQTFDSPVMLTGQN